MFTQNFVGLFIVYTDLSDMVENIKTAIKIFLGQGKQTVAHKPDPVSRLLCK